ncbi:MAG: glycine/sarcosine/betaine reductase selenoprotein B family protein [Candidatus Promineifilaceae bacterium]|nr:glycine/sarcosine/betaine reductase selenoprotein B family protein [Candidatus Promineifilaceae bacterium]
MEILENKKAWRETYQQNWLAHLEEAGEVDWSLYQHPRNEQVPGAPGVDLHQSRLLLISSAGAYLKDQQEPFDAASRTGDYTMRTFPTATSWTDLAYAHGHYDHTMIEQDAQVALPLRHLQAWAANGRLGQIAPSVISFMGYQPDSARVVDELVPQVLVAARDLNAEAALLAPV